MKKTITESCALLALFLLLGFVLMVGQRAAEWSIQKPETRVIVCMADELGTVEICRTLDDLVKHPRKPGA